MENGLSASDVALMTRNDGWGDGGSWLWFIVIIFCLFGGGYGGYGNYGGFPQVATSADVQRSTDQVQTNARFDSLFNNQSRNAMDNLTLIDRNAMDNIKLIDRNAMDNANLINANRLDNAVLIKDAQYTNLQNTNTLTNVVNQGFNNVGHQLCQGFNGVNYNMMDGFRGVDKAICQSTYAQTQVMNDGFNAVNQNINNLSHQISDGVCAIKTQMLQDKYDNLRNEYNLSTMINANSAQTQNILNTIGNWYAKPPAYPYYPYFATGYGYNNGNGTVIGG